MIYSKSRILQYCLCPLKFKFIYIDKIPMETNIYMDRGKKLHKIFELFFDHIKPETKPEHFMDILIKIAGKNAQEYDIYLKNFTKIQTRRYERNKKHFIPKMREICTDSTVGNLQIRGIIDVVEQLDGNRFIVADYKSSAIYKIHDYMFELMIYALMAREGLGLNVVGAKIYAIKNAKELYEEVTDEHIQKAVGILKKVDEKINNKEFFPNVNKYCGTCQFLKECQKMS